MLFRKNPASADQAFSKSFLADQPGHCPNVSRNVLGTRCEQARLTVMHDVWHAPYPGRDHGKPQEHGLDQHERKAALNSSLASG